MKVYKTIVAKHFPSKTTLGEVLQKVTSLPADIVKLLSLQGAVWLQRGGKGKILRARDPSMILDLTDSVTLYYDTKIVSLPEYKNPVCLEENKNYGVWIKPSGIMSQGTQTGDHTSILRAVEKIKQKEVYLVHRLDRETEGLMLIGYNPQAAALLGDLFQHNKVKKTYQAVVLGDLERGGKETISASLDGKPAVTHFEVLANSPKVSLLKVEIETGRLHQIRRHLDHIGHPVMGDPKYGKGNKNRQGLKLLAHSIAFIDPWDKNSRSWILNYDLSV